MSQSYESFGKYILLEKLQAGGMAEVFLGRSPGASGISRFVAIKRILPQFSEQPEFIDMFKDEAKIAVNLSHANIVSIFEFGMEKKQFFLAMDYVEGRNLRQILNKMKKSGVSFSTEQVLYIISQVAAGLDHAHRCIDPQTGKPLNIIHRDMSPQNVMVSFEGEVKIIDFGIAKAETQIDTTRAGTLKGKFGYMSPEQAEGQNVDLRTDIFALGIVLWELLANDRLFVANNEVNALRKIRDCQIPSLRKINPNIPPELERIVSKALAKDKNLRYQTAAAFHRELSRFLNRQYPDFSPQDFGVFIKTLFAAEILDSRKKMIEYAKTFSATPVTQEERDSERDSNRDYAETSMTVTPTATSTEPTNPASHVSTTVHPTANQTSPHTSHPTAHQTRPQTLAKTSAHQENQTSPQTAGQNDSSTANSQTNTNQVTLESINFDLTELPDGTLTGFDGNMREDPNDAKRAANEPTRVMSKPPPPHPSQSLVVKGRPSEGVYVPPDIKSGSGTQQRTSNRPSTQQRISTEELTVDRSPYREHSVTGYSTGSYHSGRSVSYRKKKRFALPGMFPILMLIVSLGFAMGGLYYYDPVSFKMIARYIPNLKPATNRPQEVMPNTTDFASAGTHDIGITSSPPGAEILIDDEPKGEVTPATLKLDANKKVKLTLRLPGYLTYEESFEVNSERTINATLISERRGYLDIQVVGAGQIYVDGKLVATGSPANGIPVSAGRDIVVSAIDPVTKAADEQRVRVVENKKLRVVLIPRAPLKSKQDATQKK